MFEFKFDRRQVASLQRHFNDCPRLAKKAEVGAVRETLKLGVKEIVYRVAKPAGLLNIGIGIAKKYISIKRRPKTKTPYGQIHIRGEAVRLAWFGARKTKKGITYQEFRGGGRRLLENAFIIKKGKFKGMFRRVKTKREHAKTGKTQYKQYFGPSITDLWKFSPQTKEKINFNIKKMLKRKLSNHIDKQLRYKVTG